MKYSGVAALTWQLPIRLLFARPLYHSTIGAVNSNHDACHVWPRDDAEMPVRSGFLARAGQLACRHCNVETSARHITCRWEPSA